jgi:hypothetical protein
MKFTLRDLFWLMAVVSVLCAWYADRQLLATARTTDRAYYAKSTLMILQSREAVRAENEVLKAKLQQTAATP